MKMNGRLIFFTLILVLLTTGYKVFLGPDLAWSGFSPVIAIALFSGMIMRERNMTFILPLLSVFLSDVLIEVLYRQGLFEYPGFYGSQFRNYLILLLPATVLGWFVQGKNVKGMFLGALAAPTVFFLLSNLNVWITQDVTYSKDLTGLLNCYAAGLPFYKNALLGTLVFLPLIVVGYNLVVRHRRQLTLA